MPKNGSSRVDNFWIFWYTPALSEEGFVLKSLECTVCRVRLGYGGVDACTVMTFFNPEHPRAEQANLG